MPEVLLDAGVLRGQQARPATALVEQTRKPGPLRGAENVQRVREWRAAHPGY
jgi:hypothetical protein